MTNSLLTVDKITKEALAILHQKATFLSGVNKAYDDSFANEGAKIGDTLRIRLPNEYVIRDGATLNTQDVTEQQVTLPVQTQIGVDLNFTSRDLTMDMESFSERILDPAISVLASNIESRMLQAVSNDIYQIVDSDATALSFKDFTDGGALLTNSLTPLTQRTALLSPTSNSTIVNANKGLFQASTSIARQYTEGVMGRSAGFDFMESSHVSDHVTGTAAKTTGYVTDGGDQTGSTLVIDTGSTTFLAGDIITIADVFRVHPETKVTLTTLQTFVVTADSGANATSLAISPAIVITGGTQNVSNAAGDTKALVKVGAGANESLNGDIVYHKNAFTFATADLVMPDGVDFKSRQVFEGISMRIVRAYDINNDKFPVRLDVLYGHKTIRPQLAARVHADG